jgi:ribosomal protein L37AE/L43A
LGNISLIERRIMEKKGNQEKEVYGEKCSKCKRGIMIHNKLYTWKCSHCGYQYTIDPNASKHERSVFDKFINED